MRIAYDATAAAVQRAGVGRYARELLKALVQRPEDDRYTLACACTGELAEQLLNELPPGAWREIAQLPFSERIASIAFQRARLPIPIEHFIGTCDVYHATDFVAPPSRAPLVVTIHDLSFLVAPEHGFGSLVEFLQSAVPRTLQRASIVIAVSSSIAVELADAYPFVSDRIVSIPHGVALPRELAVSSRGRRPIVLTVGTVEPRKNHDTLLDSIALLRETHPDVLLVVAGRVGWCAERIVNRLRAAERAGWAEFVEAPSDQELERQYARASVFAFPSWYEGFGLPVLEAFARGIPVVAGDTPALREIADEVARFAPSGDAEAIATTIAGLLDDGSECERMEELGRARARQFTWTRCAKMTRRAYALAIEA